MLGVGKKLSAGWSGSEVGNLGEVEVEGQVLASVPDGEDHVSSFILGALSKLEGLTVDFDVRVLGASHHLDLEVAVRDAEFAVLVKLDDSERGIVLGLDREPALAGVCLSHTQ